MRVSQFILLLAKFCHAVGAAGAFTIRLFLPVWAVCLTALLLSRLIILIQLSLSLSLSAPSSLSFAEQPHTQSGRHNRSSSRAGGVHHRWYINQQYNFVATQELSKKKTENNKKKRTESLFTAAATLTFSQASVSVSSALTDFSVLIWQ